MADNLIINQKTEDRFETLLNNANAARVISQTVEGTLGPKGLDIMMVDNFGDVVITNDGVTILNLMEVNHPAARMIINTARAQQAEIGDGTTTATIMAGALIAEGCQQVLKGVPVTRVIEGINLAIDEAIKIVTEHAQVIRKSDEKLLLDVALIAGRGHEDIARLVVDGAMEIGLETLRSPDYKLVDTIMAREFANNEVIKGIIINKEPLNKEMPKSLTDLKILVIDDNLAPEEIAAETLKTEAGFKYYLQAKNRYQENLLKIIDLGINVVIVDRAIDDIAEELFTQAGITCLHRVSSREIEYLCKYTGAKKIKRSSLNRTSEEIAKFLGYATQIIVDEKLEYTIIYDGQGEKNVTIMLGAATEEVVDEKERMAKDAASALQSAIQGGIVPGGGAMELWVASKLEGLAKETDGMVSWGVNCVKEALTKPFNCIVANAGFNPLEKLGDLVAKQCKENNYALGMDLETGQVISVLEAGIVDAAPVKIYAIKAAGEVATAILKINTIIRMKSEDNLNSKYEMFD